MGITEAYQRIVVAFDGVEELHLGLLASHLKGRAGACKFHDHWDEHGVTLARWFHGLMNRVEGGVDTLLWADLKLHDIPNTVALRARQARRAGVGILTVHASGGVEMMRAAVENGPPKVLAVTVLTSLDEATCQRIYGKSVSEAVVMFALLAKEAGVHGMVCSPKELPLLTSLDDLRGVAFYTPGIRQLGKEVGDQKRVDTPAAAIKAGATHLVIGRPITQAPDPVAAFETIAEEIAQAMAEREGR